MITISVFVCNYSWTFCLFLFKSSAGVPDQLGLAACLQSSVLQTEASVIKPMLDSTYKWSIFHKTVAFVYMNLVNVITFRLILKHIYRLHPKIAYMNCLQPFLVPACWPPQPPTTFVGLLVGMGGRPGHHVRCGWCVHKKIPGFVDSGVL